LREQKHSAKAIDVDYHVWGAMLEAYSQLKKKPWTIAELKLHRWRSGTKFFKSQWQKLLNIYYTFNTASSFSIRTVVYVLVTWNVDIHGKPKNGLFLRSHNFATTNDRKARNTSKVS